MDNFDPLSNKWYNYFVSEREEIYTQVKNFNKRIA